MDITLDPSSAAPSIACYASWPLQKRGRLDFQSAFSLTETCVDVDLPVVVSDCASSYPVPLTVDPITIKGSGSTVKSFVVDIDPVRRLLGTREAWAREGGLVFELIVFRVFSFSVCCFPAYCTSFDILSTPLNPVCALK